MTVSNAHELIAKDDRRSDAPARSAARLAAVQGLFQMEASGTGVDAVIREFEAHRLGATLDGAKLAAADRTLFSDILRGAVETQNRLDPYIERQLAENWKLSRIDATIRAILRAGLYEMFRRPDIPFKVVIDEYVEIAKSFFEDGEEPGFINGVLDAAARAARDDEFEI
ncbi:MAG: transcription antitermination factor NusB [Pseudomonadota bacterium]